MKRLLTIFMIFIVSLSLSAADGNDAVGLIKNIESFEPLLVEFTSSQTVLTGFSRQKVTTTTLDGIDDISATGVANPPAGGSSESDIGGKYFGYDSDHGYFTIGNIYYYAQVFMSKEVTIKISGTPLKQSSSDTSSPKTVHWKSEPGVYGGQYIDTELNQSITLNENTMDVDLKYPRVYSDEIQIRIPGDDVPDTNYGYSAVLTITVEGA